MDMIEIGKASGFSFPNVVDFVGRPKRPCGVDAEAQRFSLQRQIHAPER